MESNEQRRPALVSGRLLLRPLGERDAEQAFALRVANRAFLQPFEPVRDESFFTLDGQREVIAREAEQLAAGTAYSFGVFRRAAAAGEVDELIGRMSLSSVFRGPWQNANVGYFLAEHCNGQGYASESLGLLQRFAFGELGLHRLQAAVMTHNERSARVLVKNGFRKEGLALRYLQINGQWEDHILYARTAEEAAEDGDNGRTADRPK
ncbi:ribosomal-protein-alanine N-acetyltransferase [Paenibacillus sp. J31TS4]|uniref:GNAT family N-acetyltransferase n=1 Tax=Paenibacillus sp. J31TS4 TaxID=2807195 RepID=UPI001B14FE71|nr:GNAT family N-acetyltransferase [Paenibacillus sp. J31TS4]GIP39093.1 ribosomal-protein-alanine N-acetyltransferase [Paenibacillus sp. J31TS4]